MLTSPLAGRLPAEMLHHNESLEQHMARTSPPIKFERVCRDDRVAQLDALRVVLGLPRRLG